VHALGRCSSFGLIVGAGLAICFRVISLRREREIFVYMVIRHVVGSCDLGD
jgi:hypothetical protein